MEKKHREGVAAVPPSSRLSRDFVATSPATAKQCVDKSARETKQTLCGQRQFPCRPCQQQKGAGEWQGCYEASHQWL